MVEHQDRLEEAIEVIRDLWTGKLKSSQRIGDGLIGTAPVAESVKQFRSEGGEGKPTYDQLHV